MGRVILEEGGGGGGRGGRGVRLPGSYVLHFLVDNREMATGGLGRVGEVGERRGGGGGGGEEEEREGAL